MSTMRQENEARLQRMKQAVQGLYDRNRQKGVAPWCNRPYDFVCPSTGTYPFQWFWDSCFHAVALSHLDTGRARSEVRGLLANQQPDGFIGHVTFWQRERYEELLSTYSIAYRTPHLSDCIQPPVLAEALQAAAKGEGRVEFLKEAAPKVRAWFDWVDRVRDPDRDGLIATLQPDESGLDHTPKYDGYLGVREATHEELTLAWNRCTAPYAKVGRDAEKMFAADQFVCEDVLVNTIYAENQRVLARLLGEIGDAQGAAELNRRADLTVKSLLEKCWDEEAGLFFDLAGLREERLRISTVSSLMPLLLPELPRRMADRLVAQLQDPKKYAAPYPVPSVAQDEPSFVPGVVGEKLVWRGPSWINTNWYIARGLRRQGHEALARNIEDRSAELVERFGFREYYNPHTGEGHGAEDFSWSGLALDMLASRS
jgi:glycogen debranching enzyme